MPCHENVVLLKCRNSRYDFHQFKVEGVNSKERPYIYIPYICVCMYICVYVRILYICVYIYVYIFILIMTVQHFFSRYF